MRIYSTISKQGDKLEDLQSVIQINLIDNVKMKFDPNIKSEYYIINGNDIEDKKIADEFKMIYYRIDKAKEIPYNELTEEVRWIRFLGAQSSEERRLLAEGDEMLMELNDWVEKFINDEEIKEFYGKWSKELLKEQMEYEKTEEIAKKMKETGSTIEYISKITDLSIEEIEKL